MGSLLDVNEKKYIYFNSTLPEYGNNSIKVLMQEEDDNLTDNYYYIDVHIPKKTNVLSIYNDLNNIKYVSLEEEEGK